MVYMYTLSIENDLRGNNVTNKINANIVYFELSVFFDNSSLL